MSRLQVLTIKFENELQHNELQSFRGAVINSLEGKNDLLFHNHIGDNFRYAYPLIQYKRINKRASIVCVAEGTQEIGQFFSTGNFNFKLGERSVEMVVDQIFAKNYNVQLWQDEFQYYLRNWLPLNGDNYKQFRNFQSDLERDNFLQKILIGNILSFLKGVGITVESQILCRIDKILHVGRQQYKGVKLMSFDLIFTTNISLPDFIGLGKSASLGNGMVCMVNN
ncbi:MAG: hypothetical protein MJ211_05905 [Bacteroidales bacterium]|nr:hypothetical protein [Bacteroidales bacterium]